MPDASAATLLAEAFLAQVEDELGGLGFKRRRRDYTYRREAGPARQYIHFTIVKHRVAAQVSVDVAVRLHAVEEAIPRHPKVPPKTARDRATVGVELGNWTGAGWRSWNLAAPEDVGPVVRALLTEVRRVGLPFLERFSSVSEVHDVLARGGSEAQLICPLRERWPEILEAGTSILSGTA